MPAFTPVPERPDGMKALMSATDRRGRATIIVDEWGPYDYQSPKLWPVGKPTDRPLKLRVLGPEGRWTLKSLTGGTTRLAAGDSTLYPGQGTPGQAQNLSVSSGAVLDLAGDGGAIADDVDLERHAQRDGGQQPRHDRAQHGAVHQHPRTRHALQGMTVGTVREEWAREHHAKWVAELDARGAVGDQREE